MKKTKLISLEELHRRSVVSRQATAAARRVKVSALKNKGLSGPQIAAELDIKLRTVYHDFSILKKEITQ